MNDVDDSHPPSPREPPPGLLVRAVWPSDADAVAEMVNLPGYRWGTLQLPFRSPEEIKRRLEGAGSDTLSLIATMENEVVGNASLDRMSRRRIHAGQVGMGVHDAWTGQGVGTALLGALLEAADNWLGLRRIELTVWTDNAPALALYRRFGFGVEGTLRAYALREGRIVDAHAMARLMAETVRGDVFPSQLRVCRTHAWLAALPALLFLSLVPGPNNLLAASDGLRFGAGPAALAVAGRIAAFVVLIGLTLVGLGALLAASEAAFAMVKWGSATCSQPAG